MVYIFELVLVEKTTSNKFKNSCPNQASTYMQSRCIQSHKLILILKVSRDDANKVLFAAQSRVDIFWGSLVGERTINKYEVVLLIKNHSSDKTRARSCHL